MDATEASNQTSPVGKLANYPVLQRLRRALRHQLTRVWPTRYQALCPPAYAALVSADGLEMPELSAHTSSRCLLIFLPHDYAARLQTLATMKPCVRIHPDIGLLSQVAYLSWSAPSAPGELPMTVWVKLCELAGILDETTTPGETSTLPLVLAAGESFVIGAVEADDALRRQCAVAMTTCLRTPTGYSEQELIKAQETARKYSEQPWLLMRYELKNASKRLAVNMAPVVRMRAAPTGLVPARTADLGGAV